MSILVSCDLSSICPFHLCCQIDWHKVVYNIFLLFFYTCKDPALSQHAGQFCSCPSATAVLWEGAPEGPAESACSEMAVGAQRSKRPPGTWQNLPCHSHYVSKEMTGSHCSSQHGLDRSGCQGGPRVPLCSALTSSMLHLNSGGPAWGQCQPLSWALLMQGPKLGLP